LPRLLADTLLAVIRRIGKVIDLPHPTDGQKPRCAHLGPNSRVAGIL